ncbi:MAG TPA: hypothetical protein VL547_08370 [Dinghuibacter sp.]|uniref:CTP synthase C-terminal region-related (seleno)protein n=1 Tax=Dinghuibacter sp. TaxID=2024697 RepID=UPI002CCAB8EC|nr:hypothetical protein [Dinghuibacter sp.]HTJ12025.1 hypothetical protein [Dinghuibacter sp.]
MKLAIIGDFRKENATHVATNEAINHSLTQIGASLDVEWVHTATIPTRLAQFADAFLIAPGSPYADMASALSVIRYARENGIPTFGTCGGFQHIVIEYARNALGLTDADHAESNPYASRLVVTPLTCSLVGQRLDVAVRPGSLAHTLTGPRLTENYYCNFGLNPDYQDALDRSGLRIAATSDDGEVRILELAGHPFFMGTLFVPQASSTAAHPHPLVTGFLRAALRQRHR